MESHSPKTKYVSPMPLRTRTSFHISPMHTGAGITFQPIVFGPPESHKSLPRPAPVFPHLKANRRSRANTVTKNDQHIRGAIDIVKGLEQKRQRRREKFLQKYCNRARMGHVHEKRPQPGKGAERMKEWVTGKIGQGNYVLSV